MEDSFKYTFDIVINDQRWTSPWFFGTEEHMKTRLKSLVESLPITAENIKVVM